MSEQLVNLYGSIQSTVAIPTLSPSITLALAYTAGSGSIKVSAATDPISGAALPSTGTFSVTILNQETGAVYLIFRVSSVAGTVLTGAAEGPDANAPLGAAVVGTMLTAAAITQIKADAGGGGGGGFIQPLTAPVPASFSQINFNQGSGVVTTQVNNTSPVASITLCQSDINNTNEIAAIAKAKINVLFTITLGFTVYTSGDTALCGIWFSDGTALNMFFGINTDGSGQIVTLLNNFSGAFNSNIFFCINSPNPIGPLVWCRLQETLTERIYSISTDGINFFEFASESNTAHFTTVNYGFGMRCGAATAAAIMCAYSFNETTP